VAPAVKELKTRPVRIVQQVVHPVLGSREITMGEGDGGDPGQAHDLLRGAGGEVHAPDARALGSQFVPPGIGQARIAVTRSHVLNAPKVGHHSRPTVGRQGVHGRGDGPLLARGGVEQTRDVAVAVTIVPDNRASGTRNPLQHAALLPAPGPRAAQVDPAVAVGEVHHAHADLVLRRRGTVLEAHLHAQHVATRRVKLQLVIIAEPVIARLARYRPAGDRL